MFGTAVDGAEMSGSVILGRRAGFEEDEEAIVLVFFSDSDKTEKRCLCGVGGGDIECGDEGT